MSGRPKVLVLTPRFPYPIVGGDRLRIYHICKELSHTCDITLLSLCENLHEGNSRDLNDGVFTAVHLVPLPRWRSALNTFLAIPTKTPLQVAYYKSSQFSAKAHELIQQHDVCIAHLIRTGDHVRMSRTPKILEMTDAISLNYKRVKDSKEKVGWKGWVYSLEANRLLTYERRTIEEFDAVTLVSSVDRDFLLQGRDSSRVFVCSNGVDVQKFPYVERTDRRRVISFVGNMKTIQNQDACLHFIKDVLPLLRNEGDFVFKIVGRISSADAARFALFDGVEVAANVADVPAALATSYAAVAPMRLGAGVQNKILEYLSMGVPAVTSSVGLEGLQATPGKDLLVADDPQTWVRSLIHLWNDRDAASAQAKSGRRYVEDHHAWRTHLAPLARTVHRLSAEGRLRTE